MFSSSLSHYKSIIYMVEAGGVETSYLLVTLNLLILGSTRSTKIH